MKLMGLLSMVFLVAVTHGCAGGGPRMEEIELSETQQRFRTKTIFKDGLVGVEVRRGDGSTRTLDSVRDIERTWARYSPPPAMPGTASREWLLVQNHHDGRLYAYATIGWDVDNPADYLAAGWWAHFPPGVSRRNVEEAETGVFIDGPEIDPSNPPEMPVTGEATYAGSVGGVYRYNYGSGWGELEGRSQYTEFGAVIGLRANFADGTVQGCIGCTGDIEVQAGEYLYPIVTWWNRDPVALPTDYELRLGPTPLDSHGTFENTDVTVTHPDRTVTEATGVWAGHFSNVPDPDGNPRRVVGLSDVAFDEADGSSGSFMGIFSALTPATLMPSEGETP
ncbi:MAG: hypothetical protein OXU42_16405 [Deltaproteobacteria bacterium]|nr:hypothetical protein [Deltaproteobacteria bacterium]